MSQRANPRKSQSGFADSEDIFPQRRRRVRRRSPEVGGRGGDGGGGAAPAYRSSNTSQGRHQRSGPPPPPYPTSPKNPPQQQQSSRRPPQDPHFKSISRVVKPESSSPPRQRPPPPPPRSSRRDPPRVRRWVRKDQLETMVGERPAYEETSTRPVWKRPLRSVALNPNVSEGDDFKEVLSDFLAASNNVMKERGFDVTGKAKVEKDGDGAIVEGIGEGQDAVDRRSVEDIFTMTLIEEGQIIADLRRYDVKNMKISRSPGKRGLWRVEVEEELSERRPSVMPHDRVYVIDRSVRHVGYVWEVGGKYLDISFHSSFNAERKSLDLRFLPMRTSYFLMYRALRECKDVYDRLVPKGLDVSGSDGGSEEDCFEDVQYFIRDAKIISGVKLNDNQKKCVQEITNQEAKPLVLWGPPGTGKTTTLVEGVLKVLEGGGKKVLIATPSNTSADEVAKMLVRHLGKSKMLRMFGIMRNPSTTCAELRDHSLPARGGRHHRLPSREEAEGYDVIVCTCAASGYLWSLGMEKGHFSHIFLDEIGQGLLGEAMIPLHLATDTTHIVLAGDQKQLGPVVRSPLCVRFGLGRSLLQQVMEYKGAQVVQLHDSYRPHEAIGELFSSLFYDGSLEFKAPSEVANVFVGWQVLPNPNVPLIFQHVNGEEKRPENSPSWYNEAEQDEVIKYTKHVLDSRRAKEGEILVITPYHQQKKDLKRRMRSEGYFNVVVESVEGCQGREAKVVIISCVRSREQNAKYDKQWELGFLSSQRRTNVAISRARSLLVIIGNTALLGKDRTWKNLIAKFEAHKAVKGMPLSPSGTQTSIISTTEVSSNGSDDFEVIEDDREFVDRNG